MEHVDARSLGAEAQEALRTPAVKAVLKGMIQHVTVCFSPSKLLSNLVSGRLLTRRLSHWLFVRFHL
jgi:hypothetical protein